MTGRAGPSAAPSLDSPLTLLGRDPSAGTPVRCSPLGASEQAPRFSPRGAAGPPLTPPWPQAPLAPPLLAKGRLESSRCRDGGWWELLTPLPPCKGFSCSVHIKGAALSRLARRFLARLAGRATSGPPIGCLLLTQREGGNGLSPAHPGQASPGHSPVRAQGCPCQSGDFEGSLKGVLSPASARGHLSRHAPPPPCDLGKIPF